MSNIIDYIKWRGDIGVESSPFCDIDCLILSQIAMINFKGIIPAIFEPGNITLSDAADAYFADTERSACSLGAIIPPETKELFKEAGKSVRFGNMRFSAYVSHINLEEQTQFAALTVDIDDSARCIIFRGTDDTLVGWKEDFNLSYMSPIPAQTGAVKYLEEVCGGFNGKIYVGGHSKGGNLAVYAATKADVSIQDRIIAVYNHDAPGFKREFLSLPEHVRIENRISTVIPQSSIVGMLFENKGHYNIVKSTMSGIMQHNPFSWEIIGNSFIKLDSLTLVGRNVAKAINDRMAKATPEECRALADAFYNILTATDSATLSDLKADKYAIVRAVMHADKKTRSVVFSIVGIIFEEFGRIFKDNIFSFAKNKKLSDDEKKQFVEVFTDTQNVFKELSDGGDIPQADNKPDRASELKNKPNDKAKTRYIPPDGKATLMTDLAYATRQVVKKTIK